MELQARSFILNPVRIGALTLGTSRTAAFRSERLKDEQWAIDRRFFENAGVSKSRARISRPALVSHITLTNLATEGWLNSAFLSKRSPETPLR